MVAPRPRVLILLFALTSCALPACGSRATESPATRAAEYLYLWTASADATQPDFLPCWT
jgi:hypothetical protein